MSLELLFNDPAEFLAEWPTEPSLHSHRPGTFDHLLTLAQMDALIDRNCLPLGNVAVIADHRPVDDRLYAGANGLPRAGALRQYLDHGATVTVRGLERLVPAIAELRMALQSQTGYAVHMNAYYTPAGAQGFKYHFDPYATVILQINGCKAWPYHLPFDTTRNAVQEYRNFKEVGFTSDQLAFLATTPPADTPTLTPQDVFFLPRGHPHSPYTVGEEPSLHVTVAFKERTQQWVAAQLAGLVARMALQDTAMRAAVPPAALLDPFAAVQDARSYLVGAMLSLDPQEAAAQVRTAALRDES